jgi:hypothetical protein
MRLIDGVENERLVDGRFISRTHGMENERPESAGNRCFVRCKINGPNNWGGEDPPARIGLHS